MIKNLLCNVTLNWPNLITRLCLVPKLFSKICSVSCLGIWWRHDIWITEKLKFDYLMNKKNFTSYLKVIFLVSQVLSFRHTKQTRKNVANTNFKPDSLHYHFFYQACNIQNIPLLELVFNKGKGETIAGLH